MLFPLESTPLAVSYLSSAVMRACFAWVTAAWAVAMSEEVGPALSWSNFAWALFRAASAESAAPCAAARSA